MLCKNYSINDFQSLSQTKKIESNQNTGYQQTSNPQTTPTISKNIEIDMNHPNEILHPQMINHTNLTHPVQQYPYYHPPQQHMQQPHYQQSQYGQLQQPQYYNPYYPPPLRKEDDDSIKFKTKTGKEVKFRKKKEQKKKKDEVVIIKNEQTKLENVPEQHN